MEGVTTRVISDTTGLPIAVTPSVGLPKTRKVQQILGFGATVSWGIHNNNLRNLLRGLVERVYRVNTPLGLQPPPRPSPGLFFLRMYTALNALRKWTPRTAPVDYAQFVEYYRGRKRTIYQAAADSLLQKPVEVRDANLRTFVKAEKVNFTAKPDPAPRVIQPRSPRFNVEVGRFLKPIEKLVYRAIAKAWGGPTVLKGLNATQTATVLRSMWDEFSQPVGLGLDASRFDQHVSADALRWEHTIYGMFFNQADRAELMRLLDMQIYNKGTAFLPEAKVKYTVEGCRMSGDINTSTGNCLLMSMMVWSWAETVGVRCRLANNGDDCVVIMEQRDLGRFRSGMDQWFVEMGFTLTSEPPAIVFEEIEFCQTKPVFDGTCWTMVRNPHICIPKDLVSLLDIERSFPKWAASIGECGLSLTGGLPILQEFYLMLRNSGSKEIRVDGKDNLVGCGMAMMAAGMTRQYSPVTWEARVSFALAFGITPDEQVIMERWLRAFPVPKHMQVVADLPNLWVK